jgi:diguanylate cyclase (GGDEF)-like protein
MGARTLTLDPSEISRFLVRQRKDWGIGQLELRLDQFLSEILEKANEFVPSESGSLLLDDPRAKGRSDAINTLTFIACFGPNAPRLLGRQIPLDNGVAGRVYTTAQPYISQNVSKDERFYDAMDRHADDKTRSIIAVPVTVGDSIFGVLELLNRRDHGFYSAGDLLLLETFAGYISSSIQNALDAIRAREAARRDDLTRLYNDRYLHHRLTEELPRSERDALDLSLLFLDLDHFKAVNDRYGHLVGSRTLKEVGYLIQSWNPPGAVPARYGGDEFVIILPGYDAAKAMVVAERLRELVEETVFCVVPANERAPAEGAEFEPLDGPLTCSVGVASLNEHVAPQGTVLRRQNALIRLADKAMYEAKRLGRNLVIRAGAEVHDLRD